MVLRGSQNDKKSLWRSFGVVGLCILSIPTWILLFLSLLLSFTTLLGVQDKLSNPYKDSYNLNLSLVHGDLSIEEDEIHSVELFRDTNDNERIKLPNDFRYREPVYKFYNDELFNNLLHVLDCTQPLSSPCPLTQNQKYYWALIARRNHKSSGSFFFYFCKTEEQKLVIGVLDDSNVPMNYFENNEMEKLLKSIGITP